MQKHTSPPTPELRLHIFRLAASSDLASCSDFSKTSTRNKLGSEIHMPAMLTQQGTFSHVQTLMPRPKLYCHSKGSGISVGGYWGSEVSPQGATQPQPPAMGGACHDDRLVLKRDAEIT